MTRTNPVENFFVVHVLVTHEIQIPLVLICVVHLIASQKIM